MANTGPGLPCAPKTCLIRRPFLAPAGPAAVALPPGEHKAEPVARARQSLQWSRWREGNGSVLTWFSRGTPGHGVSMVAVRMAEHMAAERLLRQSLCSGAAGNPPLRREGLWGQIQMEPQPAPLPADAGSRGDSGCPGEGTSPVSSLECCCWLRPGRSVGRWMLGSLTSPGQKKGLWPSCFPAEPLRHSLPRFPCPPAMLVLRGMSGCVLPGAMGHAKLAAPAPLGCQESPGAA